MTLQSVQKFIQRAASNRKRSVRARLKKKARFEKQLYKAALDSNNMVTVMRNDYFKLDVKPRWMKDWNAGPLAPRHDLGMAPGEFGTLDGYDFINYTVPPQNSSKWIYPFREGDTVAVANGRYKGRIGKIEHVELRTADARLSGINKSDLRKSEEERFATGSKDPYGTQEIPLRMDDLRLVAFVSKTGQNGIKAEQPVIVDAVTLLHADDLPRFRPELKGSKEYREPVPPKLFKHKRHADDETVVRFIAGTNIEVPWPHNEPDLVDEHDCDTKRIEVEDATYMPQLHQAPLPDGLIDELRNKYSNYRVRHDPEYLAKRAYEFQKAEDLKNPDLNHIRTPLQEMRWQQNKKAAERTSEEEAAHERLMRGEISLVQYLAIKHKVPEERLAGILPATAGEQRPSV
ncbi:hypothetical protein EJ05DRAFT_305649 [Pseudovirgaria hyperparasitica]|uniref:KOW domain-containing protein n=1 Tax=Pseudovirgaria hyperparasitica TaxID=470096 RepID=A0A6A6WAF2_9PEZI|nr:uncharacterized protein EJ05DRAFT_305649 [Pseudovirgaria hyperparasitica]KAF2759653.1 hypothetical protein EJ05DRAFT_305649 [Pseudovirgaria hyperparasitica]